MAHAELTQAREGRGDAPSPPLLCGLARGQSLGTFWSKSAAHFAVWPRFVILCRRAWSRGYGLPSFPLIWSRNGVILSLWLAMLGAAVASVVPSTCE